MFIIIYITLIYLIIGFVISIFTVDTSNIGYVYDCSDILLLAWVIAWPLMSIAKGMIFLHRRLTR